MLNLYMYVFIMCTFLQFYTHMTYDMYIFGIAGWPLAGLLWIPQFDCIPPFCSVSSLWHSMFAKDSIPHPEFFPGVLKSCWSFLSSFQVAAFQSRSKALEGKTTPNPIICPKCDFCGLIVMTCISELGLTRKFLN